jgi:Sugar kinases, ribokinase family
MRKGIFLGLATVDIVYYVCRYPQRNEKLKAERQLAYAGGPAANAAVAFSAFGNEASLITGLGQYPLADLARVDLADHKVRLIDSTDQPHRPPVLSAIIVDLSTGERTVVYSNTDLRKLRPDTINASTLEDADIFMIDGYYLPQAVQLAALAKTRRIPVVFDGGSWKEGLETLLPLVDYAICSFDFHPPGCADIGSVFADLRSYGIEHIAVTRGGDSILAHTGGELHEIPVSEVNVVDTLGAGDIFHGAFCHYILQNDFIVSIERASEVASLSCGSPGTRAWIEQERYV